MLSYDIYITKSMYIFVYMSEISLHCVNQGIWICILMIDVSVWIPHLSVKRTGQEWSRVLALANALDWLCTMKSHKHRFSRMQSSVYSQGWRSRFNHLMHIKIKPCMHADSFVSCACDKAYISSLFLFPQGLKLPHMPTAKARKTDRILERSICIYIFMCKLHNYTN